jgi:hypothetical protein
MTSQYSGEFVNLTRIVFRRIILYFILFYFILFYFLGQLVPPITYDWTGLQILDHSYLVGNLANSKIAETKALEPLKS